MSDGSGKASTSRWSDLVAADHLFATITISLGIVLFAFNAFVVSTALPTAVKDLGNAHLLPWATSIYLIFAIVSGVAGAPAMHRFGARAMFMAAAVAFIVGTILCGAAPSMPVLLAGRAFQGIGGGAIEAGCYVLIPRLFPPRLIPKVFGVEAAAWAVAAFGAPALSGYLAEAVSWRAALLSALPLALVFVALIPVVVRDDMEEGTAPSLPAATLAAIAAGMALVMAADTAAGPAMKAAVLALAILVFWTTVAIDRRAPKRLLPKGAFGLSSPMGLGLWVVLLMPLAEGSVTVYLVYTLQYLWGYTPFEAGLLTIIIAVTWSGLQMGTAHVSTPARRLVFCWLGAALQVAGLVFLVLALRFESLAFMIAALSAIGSAFGVTWGAVSQVTMEAAPAEERDLTSGLVPTMWSAGYGIGAAMFGVLGNALGFADASGDALRHVMEIVFVVACIPALAAVAAALRIAALARR
ncbi:MAG: MFS transporter [Hyphomicrobiales bacterium]